MLTVVLDHRVYFCAVFPAVCEFPLDCFSNLPARKLSVIPPNTAHFRAFLCQERRAQARVNLNIGVIPARVDRFFCAAQIRLNVADEEAQKFGRQLLTGQMYI